MDNNQPSRSALDVAIHRASHQLLDKPRVFNDSLALAILGPQTASIIQSHPDQLKSNHELRAFISVRSRYAEDQLASALVEGVHQYVILGAGLDTFAYRNPCHDTTLQVFERPDHERTGRFHYS